MDLLVFLLMGQSNMSGRGDVSASPLPDPSVLVWRESEGWVVAAEPICEDHPKAAAGLAPAFAQRLLQASPAGSTAVGFIPGAVGGSPLSDWVPGGALYEKVLAKSAKALESATGSPAFTRVTLGGALFHQGETDALDAALAESYEPRLLSMVRALREDLRTPELSVVVGTLGDFSKAPHTEEVNKALRHAAASTPGVALVEAAGLRDRGDSLHFDTASLKELGVRYFEAYSTLQGGEQSQGDAEL